jgi:hypothetical protein
MLYRASREVLAGAGFHSKSHRPCEAWPAVSSASILYKGVVTELLEPVGLNIVTSASK